MSDTQWPRFEVFQQERPDQPHRNVGSVHAPDPELALLNAKDVFVRRPNCLSMWVVPADQILAKTAQELADITWPPEAETAGPETQTYLVFQKQTQKPSDTYVIFAGEVMAANPFQALRRAVESFTDLTPWVWWVCPARSLTRSAPEDVESMFEPALEKHYRHPYHYHTVAEMHEIKKGRGKA